MLNNIKLSCEYGAPVNENFKNSDGWTCTLRYNGKQYTFPYYNGYGHRGAEPTLDEVLESLFLDADSYNNYDFEEFCSEFGYDSDSRSAKGIYNQCGKISKNLERLFGWHFDKVRDCITA
jgi:hypothetical protein